VGARALGLLLLVVQETEHVSHLVHRVHSNHRSVVMQVSDEVDGIAVTHGCGVRQTNNASLVERTEARNQLSDVAMGRDKVLSVVGPVGEGSARVVRVNGDELITSPALNPVQH